MYNIVWLSMYIWSLTALVGGYRIFNFFNIAMGLADVIFACAHWFLARRYHVVAFDIPSILDDIEVTERKRCGMTALNRLMITFVTILCMLVSLVAWRYMGEEQHPFSVYDRVRNISKYLYFATMILIGLALLNSVRKITLYLKDS